ncbi:hypothetical protein [Streptomyces erythrochromogenes]|uniref:hypothetical protein n=1 Tax=Streptomyces erythrochromogenes TaxID=285574 RepID=UPI0036C795D9
MIQGFRPSHWLAGAVLTAAALAPTASAYAGPLAPAHPERTHAHRTASLPARSAPATADEGEEGDGAHEELAGSAAGVGRERPGRPAGEPANPELLIASRPLPAHPRTGATPPPPPLPTPPSQPLPPPPPSPPRPSAAAPTARDDVTALDTALDTAPTDRAADLAAHMLPLGTGFALMGLGLGYLGVRLRRSA